MACIESLLNRRDALVFDISLDSLMPPTRPLPEDAESKVHFPLLGFDLPMHAQTTTAVIPRPRIVPSRREKPQPKVSYIAGYVFDPVELGFIPVGHWMPGPMTLKTAMTEFFTVRSSRILRFECKLWNALALVREDPELYRYVGVAWISRTVLKVNRDVFGRFINVTRPAAALYNNQGSFATHGFKEIALSEVEGVVPAEQLSDVEESVVRLFTHLTPLFNAYSRPDEVMSCRYVQSSW
jgi:hypothetical protein